MSALYKRRQTPPQDDEQHGWITLISARMGKTGQKTGAVPQIPTQKGSGFVACIQTPQKCLPSRHVFKVKARSSDENCFSERKNSGRAHAQHRFALVKTAEIKAEEKTPCRAQLILPPHCTAEGEFCPSQGHGDSSAAPKPSQDPAGIK